MTGLVLVAAILVLGGVIATVGDRLGMRVGKARLTLFKLRPRQTATLITVMTGVVISALTFGILFAVDDQLRTGVFELRGIQEELSTARSELEQAKTERRATRQDLQRAVTEQRAAQRRLRQINNSLKRAINQQAQTESQLNTTQTQLRQIQGNYQQAQTLLQSVSRQATSLRSEIQQLQADRQQQIEQRDREISQRDQIIAERDAAIAERENSLRELENQRAYLIQEVQSLVREFQGLRQGNVALLRNQTLASGIVRIVDPNAAAQAVDQLLREANRIALLRIRPGAANTNQQIIQVTAAQVEQVSGQIDDGQDYYVRVLSAGNYVVGEPCVVAGEPCVQVSLASGINQLIFRRGDVIASTPADPITMNDETLIDRISLLISASQFRARQAGALADTIQIADGRTESVANFFEQLKLYNQAVEIQTVATNDIFTASPVLLDLVASQNGRILFGTNPFQPTEPGLTAPNSLPRDQSVID